jgi:hypothetical protein
MKHVIVGLTAALAGAGLVMSLAFAQQRGDQSQGMGGHGMQGGMMGGMTEMMRGCPMMSRTGAQRGAELIPQLPPGNEKLQAQMNAEILQRVGEIAAKYAAQAK